MNRKPPHFSLSRIALVWGMAGFALTAALASGMHAQAQTIAAHNSRAPVNIDADRIELQDRENRVVLSGDVVIEQAGLTLRSERTLINFDDADQLSIQRITATGGVVVTRGDERASGDNAVYDFNRRIITMAGNVNLRRGTDNLSGGRLVIDLESGLASVDGSAAGANSAGARPGRVTGTFTVPQGRDEKPQ